MSRLNGLISRRQVTTGNDGKSAWAFFVRNLCLFHLDFEFLLTLTEDVGTVLHGCKRKRKQGWRDRFWVDGLFLRVGGRLDGLKGFLDLKCPYTRKVLKDFRKSTTNHHHRQTTNRRIPDSPP
jgi:hypothetical protein